MNEPDNLCIRCVTPTPGGDALPDRVAPQFEFLCKRLVDDRHLRRFYAVRSRELTAGEQGNAKRSEIIRSNKVVVGIRIDVGSALKTLDADGLAPIVSSKQRRG